MEILLNLTWVAISAALGAMLVKSSSRCEAVSEPRVHSRSTAWICYLVLIALLLPAISMTDDLMAMVASTDGEQVARRYEVSAVGQHHIDIHVAFVFTAHDGFCASLVCAGNLDILPTLRILNSLPRKYKRGRAPPIVA